MNVQLRAIILSMMMLTCLTFLPSGSTSEAKSTNQPPSCHADRNDTWTVGLISCTNSTSPGYTLFSPMPSTTSYLIDQQGREVHSWESPGGHRPGLSSYLLDDGDLLRAANLAQQAVGDFSGGGIAGKIERIGWDGSAEWSWEYSSMDYITHHDLEPMPNGNILAIAWEDKSEAEAAQAGRNPAIASDAPGGSSNVWPDHIIEIEPLANNQANIVWQWNAWDHLIQDYDASVDNYGVVADHPELLDINFIGATGNQAGRADWMHCNGIDYNAVLDQIVLSCKNMNEIYIIDHSTTTAEAAGHTGGNSGKGGDILYRWGNPQAYDSGLSSDQQLFGQHDVQWIEEGRAGAGDLLLFNNGVGRSPSVSSVDVIQPSFINGNYPLQANGTWGPNAPNWSWNYGEQMYAQSISGAERLPNGNTLVTYGTKGTLYEVDLNGEIVWKYINPITNQGTLTQGDEVPAGNNAGTTANAVFKVRRYAEDFSAFIGKDMTPTDYLETWTDLCPSEESIPWDIDGDGCIDDSDGDSVPDPDDLCEGYDDAIDIDNDSIPDGCDSLIDTDGDGVPDTIDSCPGFDDLLDLDNDTIPDGCDSLIDSDFDMISDVLDQCPGFDDNLDVDNDSIPDNCDDVVDNDFDGIANELDICEGFDDSIDSDNDGVPDGCDDTPNGSDTATNTTDTHSGNESNTTEQHTENTTNSSENTSQVSNESSDSESNDSDFNEMKPITVLDSNTGASKMTPQLILSFILMFSGAWLLFYVVSQRLFSTVKDPETKTAPLFIHESGIQDSTAQFNQVSSMIDLPALAAPPEPEPYIQPNQPTPPPLPAEGLPNGWTMEQWNYYGQQWLEVQK